MRLKKLFVYLGLVVLLCTLSSWAADEVDVEDEDELDSDSDNEPEDKVSNNVLEYLMISQVKLNRVF